MQINFVSLLHIYLFISSLHNAAVPLDHQNIFDVILSEAGSFGRVDVLEDRESTLHITGDNGSVGHVGSVLEFPPLIPGAPWQSSPSSHNWGSSGGQP